MLITQVDNRAQTRITVDFGAAGIKVLVADFAPITKLID
ncbi:hypothetical protein [Oceanospirillum multiglobuliferum]